MTASEEISTGNLTALNFHVKFMANKDYMGISSTYTAMHLFDLHLRFTWGTNHQSMIRLFLHHFGLMNDMAVCVNITTYRSVFCAHIFYKINFGRQSLVSRINHNLPIYVCGYSGCVCWKKSVWGVVICFRRRHPRNIHSEMWASLFMLHKYFLRAQQQKYGKYVCLENKNKEMHMFVYN